MLTKQETMRVEWYYGDFSDPEAVSGSSTNKLKIWLLVWAVFCLLFVGGNWTWSGVLKLVAVGILYMCGWRVVWY